MKKLAKKVVKKPAAKPAAAKAKANAKPTNAKPTRAAPAPWEAELTELEKRVAALEDVTELEKRVAALESALNLKAPESIDGDVSEDEGRPEVAVTLSREIPDMDRPGGRHLPFSRETPDDDEEPEGADALK